MMCACQVLAALILLVVDPVQGFAFGAPSSSCYTMRPRHLTSPRTSESPYRITISAYTYTPGQELTVTIEKKDATTSDFKGFILMAKEVGKDAIVPGKFSDVTSGKAISCQTGNRNAASHQGSRWKRRVTMKWTAPEGEKAPQKLKFQKQLLANLYMAVHTAGATVVKKYDTFWTGMESSVVERQQPVTEPVLSLCEQTVRQCMGESAAFMWNYTSLSPEGHCRVRSQVLVCLETASLWCQAELRVRLGMSDPGFERLSLWSFCAESTQCSSAVRKCLGAPLRAGNKGWSPQFCWQYMRLVSCVTYEPTGCSEDWASDKLAKLGRQAVEERCPGMKFPDVSVSPCEQTFLECLGDDKPLFENGTYNSCRVEPRVIGCVEAAAPECKPEVTSYSKLREAPDEARLSLWVTCFRQAECSGEVLGCMGDMGHVLSLPRDWTAPVACRAYLRLLSCVKIAPNSCHGDWTYMGQRQKVIRYLELRCPGQKLPLIPVTETFTEGEALEQTTFADQTKYSGQTFTMTPWTNSTSQTTQQNIHVQTRDQYVPVTGEADIKWSETTGLRLGGDPNDGTLTGNGTKQAASVYNCGASTIGYLPVAISLVYILLTSLLE